MPHPLGDPSWELFGVGGTSPVQEPESEEDLDFAVGALGSVDDTDSSDVEFEATGTLTLAPAHAAYALNAITFGGQTQDFLATNDDAVYADFLADDLPSFASLLPPLPETEAFVQSGSGGSAPLSILTAQPQLDSSTSTLLESSASESKGSADSSVTLLRSSLSASFAGSTSTSDPSPDGTVGGNLPPGGTITTGFGGEERTLSGGAPVGDTGGNLVPVVGDDGHGGGDSLLFGCTVTIGISRQRWDNQQWEPVTNSVIAAADQVRYTATVNPSGGNFTWQRKLTTDTEWQSMGTGNPIQYQEAGPGFWQIKVTVQQGGMSNCSAQTNVDVFDVWIRWEAITLFNPETNEYEINADNQNPTSHGEGWRWFAEKNSPNGPIHDKINYRVGIIPIKEGVTIYHKLFDVDDPTSQHPDLDPDPNAPDNRGGPITGSEGSYTTDSNGEVLQQIRLFVAHPGDNWRKVVAIKQDLIDAVTVVEPDEWGSLSNVRGGGAEASPMLSIWRTLRLEVDYMDVPQPPENVFNTGQPPYELYDEPPPTPPPSGQPLGAQRLPDLTLLQAFLPAYVEPKEEPSYRSAVPFNHNIEANEVAQSRAIPDFDPWYWSAYVVSSYEGPVLNDNDLDTEAGICGLTGVGSPAAEPEYSHIFLETIRDVAGEHPGWSQMVLERRTVVHEIGHQFELGEKDGTVMGRCSPDTSTDSFDEQQLDIIRDQTAI